MASPVLSLALAFVLLFEDKEETPTTLKYSTPNSSFSSDDFDVSTIHPIVDSSDSLLRTTGSVTEATRLQFHSEGHPDFTGSTDFPSRDATNRKDATTVLLRRTTGGEHVTTIPPTSTRLPRVTTEGRYPTPDFYSTSNTDIYSSKYTGYTGMRWSTTEPTTEQTDSTRYTGYTGRRWSTTEPTTEQTDSTRYTGYTGRRWSTTEPTTEQTDSTRNTDDTDWWWTTTTKRDERLCNTSPERRSSTSRYPTSSPRPTYSTEDTRFPWKWFTTPRHHVSTPPAREEPTSKPDSGSKSIPGSLRNYFVITCSDCNVFSNINVKDDRKKRDNNREQMTLHSMLQELETTLQQMEEDLNDTNEFLLSSGINSQNS